MPRLTKRTVEAVEAEAKPVYLWDDLLPGFGVKVLPTGRRRYLCKYRVGGGRGGRPRWYTLGTHGQVSCDQARELATQVLSAVARGEDPQAKKTINRQSPTLTDLWQRYETEYLPRKKSKPIEDDRQKARDFILPKLGGTKLVDLNRTDIQALHRQMSESPYQANRVLSLLSKMLNLAEVWGYRPDNTNPCRHIERYKEKARQRYLNQPELQRLGIALEGLENTGRQWPYITAAIYLLLYTGARVSEILGSRWSWVDWEHHCIHLPDSKTGAKPIFLSDAAIRVLEALRAKPEAMESDFVLKGRIKGQALVNLAKPWKQICDRAELEDARIHDLRHTAASIGVANGLTLPIIGRLLGHTQAQTTQRYAHVDSDPAILAANTIGKSIELAMTTTKLTDENP